MKPLDEREGLTSASNAEADSLCAGRHLAQSGIEDEASQSSEFGNLVHEAMWSKEAYDKLNDFQRRIVNMAKKLEESVFTQLLGEYDEKDVVREERLWITNNRKRAHSGKPDAYIIKGDIAIIEDLKSLSGEVTESVDNMQLRDLAVLLNHNMMYIREVYVFINQPLANKIPQVAKYDAKALEIARYKMIKRIKASNNKKSKRVAGTKQCAFCRAKHICKEHAEWLEEQRKVVVSTSSEVIATDSAKAIKYYFDCKKLMSACKSYVERFEDAVKKNPEAYEGFSVKDELGDRYVIDPQKFYDQISHVLSVDKLMEVIKIPIGKIEEAFVTNYIEQNNSEKPTKEHAKTVFNVLTKDFIARKTEKKLKYEAPNDTTRISNQSNAGVAAKAQQGARPS